MTLLVTNAFVVPKVEQREPFIVGDRVNDQWRGCFRWRDGAAYDVEIVDYH